MKKIFVLLTMALVFFTGCKTTYQDPAHKAEQKAAEEAEQKAWYDMAVQALNDRKFVLEADRVDFKRGRIAYVTSNTNFVSVHDNKATIQLALNTPYSGPNGIGGITVDGTVSNVSIEKDKKGNVNVSMMVQGIAVSAKVDFQLTQGTNKCTATVTPNFNSNRISFSGYLYPEDESNVFKGRSI